MHQSVERAVSKGFVNVIEALATTPEATREIWRFLLGIDWVASVKASLLPVDHPLLLQVARPRLLNWRLADALWVRLVDVEKALAARRFAPAAPVSPDAPDTVVLEVLDMFCPWNEGRYRVGSDGVQRTSDDADLTLDVGTLGSVYLGGFTFRQLARAERIVERTPGAAALADAAFPVDRAPWCPEIF
jgi:predicted acetyltransferase